MSSVSLCDITKGNEVLANIEAANKRRDALKRCFPQLAELYERFIEPKFQAAAAWQASNWRVVREGGKVRITSASQ
jgi:hypothetical protein